MSGFSILEIGALSALASLTIPLLIHIFNRSRGKIVWIGHIELVKKAKKIRVTEIKITQWILLLLRLLILSLLAFLLAGVVIESPAQVKPRVNLISPLWVSNASEQDFMESVSTAGVENYWLDTGFNQVPNDWQKVQEIATERVSQQARNLDLQTLLIKWESKSIVAEETHVFTVNNTNQLSRNSVVLKETYSFHFADSEALNLSEPVDSSPVLKNILVIFDSSRNIDQQVIANAFNFLNSIDKPRYRVNFKSSDSLLNNDNAIDADAVILLSDMALSKKLEAYINNDGLVISDGDSAESQSGLKLINPNGQPLRVFRTATWPESSTAETLWRDKIGTALLVSPHKNHIKWLSRFHPEWTDWVLLPSFPDDLADLINSNQSNLATKFDENALPLLMNSKNESEVTKSRQSVDEWILLIICLIWGMERWLAERRFNQPTNKTNAATTREGEGTRHA